MAVSESRLLSNCNYVVIHKMSLVSQKHKINVILFGLTGFGNNAFQALIQNPSINLKAVVTNKKQVNEFPYYHCPKLHDVVEEFEVPLYSGIRLSNNDSFDIIKNLDPDLIIVSTYNQLIPQTIIDLPKYGVVNFHPSLLPKYRGPTPTYSVLANGELETGVTAHFIESEQFDRGRIVLQKKIAILPDETDGLLRKRLGVLVGSMLDEAINLIRLNVKEAFVLQDERESSFFPKRTDADCLIDLSWSLERMRNRIRALTPFPGAFIVLNEKTFKVQGVSPVLNNDDQSSESSIIFETKVEGLIKFTV